MMKNKILLYLILGVLSHGLMAQNFELSLGYSQPMGDWGAADITKDAGYAKGGLVLQFGGRLSDPEDVLGPVLHMNIGMNTMDSERFGKEYAKEHWRTNPMGGGDSLMSVKMGKYYFSSIHAGLELRIPIGEIQIPIRVMAGPHMIAAPLGSTITVYGVDIDGNLNPVEEDIQGTWVSQMFGVSYQIGTGLMVSEIISIRADYFGTLLQLGQMDQNVNGMELLFPKKYESLFFTVGIMF